MRGVGVGSGFSCSEIIGRTQRLVKVAYYV